MPESMLEGGDHAARIESAFVLGFIEALFFTESDARTCAADWFTPDVIKDRADGRVSELPCDVGYTDLHPESLAAIRADCEAWQAKNAALLAFAYEYPSAGYCEKQAGRDYLYTRNGHCVGFDYREELRVQELARRADGTLTLDWEEEGLPFLAALSDLLAEAAQEAGEVHAFFGDHVTYGDAPFVHVSL